MDELKQLCYEGVVRYYNSLSTFGYKSYNEVNKVLLLIFIQDLLEGPLSLYIDENDYKTIVNVLYCLFGTTCLIDYPTFSNTTASLIQSLNIDSVRIAENNPIRFSEKESVRLVND